MLKRLSHYFQNSITYRLPRYGVLYFDHVRGEYIVLKSAITDPNEQERLEETIRKRGSGELRWNDLYAFELMLLKHRGPDDLKSKIQNLRSHYRNVAGDKEFEAYMASDAATASDVNDLDALRADLRDLLNKFFLFYSYMSARERLRKWLLLCSAIMMLVMLVLMAGIISYMQSNEANTDGRSLFFRISTISVVLFAGVTGAFISMQQRLQAAAVGGDPIYTLSTLTHGWLSIFLSPISGAVFAVVLYLFFAGQLLSGTVFPTMMTADAYGECVIAPTPPTPGPTATPSPTTSPSPTASPSPIASPAASPAASPSPSPTPRAVLLANFLRCTGPATGVSYALLVIWCFIAGFAERFVPDALSRLVTNNQPEAQKKS